MTNTFHDILDDVFDLRDVIARFEELETEKEEIESREETANELAEWHNDYDDEFQAIEEFLSEVKGYGGDEQWRGDWYPITFIMDRHFEDYAQELAEDIGAINRDSAWPNNCIDWKQAASELQMDYSSVWVMNEKGHSHCYWYR